MFQFGAGKRPVVASADGSKKKVVITGAGGRTGSLCFKKLLANPKYEVVGLVRSDSSKEALKKNLGASDEQIVVGDILGSDGASVLDQAMRGADRLVVATSAVPKIKPLSLIPVILAKITGKEGVRPKFTFKEDQVRQSCLAYIPSCGLNIPLRIRTLSPP
jgi:nucleoside-diphosphate-sugar epimerase